MALCTASEGTATFCHKVFGCQWLGVPCPRSGALQLGQVVLSGMHNHVAPALQLDYAVLMTAGNRTSMLHVTVRGHAGFHIMLC